MTAFTDPPIAVSSNPIAQKDAAETFAESDVSLSHTDTQLSGESVGIKSYPNRPVIDNPSGYIDGFFTFRLFINPNQDLQNISVKMAGSGNNLDLIRSADGTVLESKSDVSHGEWVDFAASLRAGTEYTLKLSGGGETASDMQDVSYPLTFPEFDLTGGTIKGNSRGKAYIAEALTTNHYEGSVKVHWPAPTDIYRWDAATFTRTPDGGQVTVNIEENDGTGWTEIATDISRGDSIDAAPDSAVRFRVDISRTDPRNNPTLDSIYRRYVL